MQKKRLHSREYAVNNFLVLSFSFLYLHTAVNISFNFLLIWEPLCGSLTIVTSATQKCLAHKISLTIWVKSMLCTHLNSEHIGGTPHSCHTALVILESMFLLDGIDMSLLCLYIFWNYTCAIKKGELWLLFPPAKYSGRQRRNHRTSWSSKEKLGDEWSFRPTATLLLPKNVILDFHIHLSHAWNVQSQGLMLGQFLAF